ncbi:hypothetical protein Gogos_004608 [Gossypium gossypioides]|uniref:DNA glycosylase superfamily protein n=1 Tax=Gossypium gossypioides TaxID=34282 RepID=A0A7J9CH52_GOSGO|nr:hypothetical protein [Gossypium gossypioides]
MSARKPGSKPSRKIEKCSAEATLAEEKNGLPSSKVNSHSVSVVPSVLRRHEQLLHSNLSLNASCSSDASTDSFHSRASTGRLIWSNSVGTRRKPFPSTPRSVVSDGGLDSPPGDSHRRKRCAWVTPNTDPSYVAFHDEEWGFPVHDDKEVFADFDPLAVSKLNEKKLIAPGSAASSLLSELKLRAIVENAHQISKVDSSSSWHHFLTLVGMKTVLCKSLVIDEFGSFDKYIWSFVNHKPIVSRFRYPRQVPVKTPKADVISKDLVRRGFRSVGPTVIYSFMQVSGITNDHLTSCFRFQDCITAAEGKEENGIKDIPEEKKKKDNMIESDLSMSIDELSFS